LRWANAEIARPKKTIARNMRASYQIQSVDGQIPACWNLTHSLIEV
jgi:hypothetical protein